jgi:phospholipid/cholesterol/gamma-HCH transport system substrate-binding protein
VKPVRERNQIRVAIIGTLVLLLFVVVALNFGKIPGVRPPTRTYRADFADAGGLAKGDVVRVSGVDVGTIKSIKLAGDRVRVSFTVSTAIPLGADAVVHAKVLSVLGQEYISVDPGGPPRLPSGQVIPVTQTTPAFTLIGVLGQLGAVTEQINIPQLQEALQTVSGAIANTPETVKALLQGLAKVSETIGSRQGELASLVTAAQQVTGTLATRKGQLIDLFGQSNLLLQVIQQRRGAIHQLLVDVTTLGNQLTALITTNRSQLQPLLNNLAVVSGVLAKDQGALDQAVPLLAAFDRYAANATGSTNFGQVITPTLLLPDNVVVECYNQLQRDHRSACTP